MNRMKLKGIVKRKSKKLFMYVILIYIVFSISFYYSLSNNKNSNNTKFIKFLLDGGTSDILTKDGLVNLIGGTSKYLLNIDLTNPSTIVSKELFLGKKIELGFEHNDNYNNLEELKKVSSYIEDPNPVDVNNPVVYIYNSHQLENYSSDNLDLYGITPNVMMASYLIKEKLNKKGISTIVEDTNLTNFLSLNGWGHADSYKASRIFLLDKKNKYNSLKYFIDIHRDSISKKASTIVINGRAYARILFVIGLEHKNNKDNIKSAEAINKIANKLYPGLSRGIYKKEGKGVNGIYNQDISPNAVLIELGGIENSIEEVLNTTEAISDILYNYIGSK